MVNDGGGGGGGVEMVQAMLVLPGTWQVLWMKKAFLDG